MENCFSLNKLAKRSNDLISDSIIRIKNGYSRKLDQVVVVYSKENTQLLEALLQSGYIQNYEIKQTPAVSAKTSIIKSEQLAIVVYLKYHQSLPALKGIQRLSKPSKRLYFSKKNIIKVSQEQN